VAVTYMSSIIALVASAVVVLVVLVLIARGG
jgi:hypothetical protein